MRVRGCTGPQERTPGRFPQALDPHVDSVPFHPDFERFDPFVPPQPHPPRRQIEAPCVPRARDREPLDPALGQRRPLVRAHVVQRVEPPPTLNSPIPAIAGADRDRFARRDLAKLRHTHESGHRQAQLYPAGHCRGNAFRGEHRTAGARRGTGAARLRAKRPGRNRSKPAAGSK